MERRCYELCMTLLKWLKKTLILTIACCDYLYLAGWQPFLGPVKLVKRCPRIGQLHPRLANSSVAFKGGGGESEKLTVRDLHKKQITGSLLF